MFLLCVRPGTGCDDARLRLATPDGYAVTDVARTSGRGGGVAIMYRQHFTNSAATLYQF